MKIRRITAYILAFALLFTSLPMTGMTVYAADEEHTAADDADNSDSKTGGIDVTDSEEISDGQANTGTDVQAVPEEETTQDVSDDDSAEDTAYAEEPVALMGEGDTYSVTLNALGDTDAEIQGGTFVYEDSEGHDQTVSTLTVTVPDAQKLSSAITIKSVTASDPDYIFAGWYTGNDFNIPSGSFTEYVKEPGNEYELFALFLPVHTVTFHAGSYGKFAGDAATVDVSVRDGQAFSVIPESADPNGAPDEISADDETNEVPAPPAPNDESRLFTGWFTDEDCTEPISAEEISAMVIESDLQIYAGYSTSYKITFDANGGKFSDSSETYVLTLAEGQAVGNLYPENPDFKNTGTVHKIFKGWYSDPSCTALIANISAYVPATTATTLYAGWVDCYEIIFDTNGASYANQNGRKAVQFKDGKGIKSVLVVKGKALRYGETGEEQSLFTAPSMSVTVTEKGETYDFPYYSPWYLNENGTGKRYDFDGSQGSEATNLYGFVPTSDMHFYAGKTPVLVTYDGNGVTFEEGESYYNVAKIVKDNTKLKYLVPAGTGYSELKTFSEGRLAQPSGEVIRSYSWGYKDSECRKAYTDSDVLNTDSVIYLKWSSSGSGSSSSSSSYVKVTFDAGEGYFLNAIGNPISQVTNTAKKSQNYYINSPIPKTDTDGIGFTGWYTDIALTKPYNPANTRFNAGSLQLAFPGSAGSITLYAKYGRVGTITLNAGHGYFDKSSAVSNDPSVKDKNVIVEKLVPGNAVVISDYTGRIRRDGELVFTGWYTDPDCTHKADIICAGTDREIYVPQTDADILYAGWSTFTPRDITIELDGSIKSPAYMSLDIGYKKRLIATVTPTDAEIAWYISGMTYGPGNASGLCPVILHSDGTVTGQAEGECTVYAYVDGVSSEPVNIKVSNKKVTESVCVDGVTEYTLKAGDVRRIDTVVSPDNNTVRWTSSDEAIVRVPGSGGSVDITAGTKEGTATVTASTTVQKTATAKVIVHVTKPVTFDTNTMILTGRDGAYGEFSSSMMDIYKDDIVYSVVDEEGNPTAHLTIAEIPGSETPSAENSNVIRRYRVSVADGLDLTNTEILYAKATVTASDNGQTYTDSCKITVNPLPKLGEPGANIGAEEPVITVREGTKVFLYSPVAGAKIYYTLDKTYPTAVPEQLYSEAITIDSSLETLPEHKVSIRAIAVKDGWRDSDVAKFDYLIDHSWGQAGDDIPDGIRAVLGDDPRNVPQGLWYVFGNTAKGYSAVYSDDAPYDHTPVYTLTYNGTKQTFNDSIYVYHGNRRLIENRDYTVSYAYNQNVPKGDGTKEPTVTIKGKGSYIAKASFVFGIEREDINEATLTSEESVTAKSGSQIGSVKPSLTYNGRKLTLNKDYELNYYMYDGGTPREIGYSSNMIPGTVYEIEMVAARPTANIVPQFTGTRTQRVTVRAYDTGTMTFASSLKVSIKAQPWREAGYTIEDIFTASGTDAPIAVVRDGSRDLIYGTDYTVTADQAGTLKDSDRKYRLTIHGVPASGYAGDKSVTFEIKGTPIGKAKIAGLASAVEYTYDSITAADLFKADKVTAAEGWDSVTLYTTYKDENKVPHTEVLTEGTDYEVDMDNTGVTGKFSIVFRGKGRYSGTLKKTVTVKPYNINDTAKTGTDKRIEITASSAPYCKNGAIPDVTVTYTYHDNVTNTDKVMTLREGIDYTLSYKNNTKVALKTDRKPPTVTVKGKGNFTGTNATRTFDIDKAWIDSRGTDTATVELVMADKVYKPDAKKNYFVSAPKIMDNGKQLTVGRKDSERDKKDVIVTEYRYYYAEDVVLDDGSDRYAENIIPATDVVPAGTLIRVEADVYCGSKSPYKSHESARLVGYYRITGKDISKASASIRKESADKVQFDNGKLIIPLKTEDIAVTLKGVGEISAVDYEVLSVTNNRFLGTATVTIRGRGEYGGIKSFTFKVTAKKLQ